MRTPLLVILLAFYCKTSAHPAEIFEQERCQTCLPLQNRDTDGSSRGYRWCPCEGSGVTPTEVASSAFLFCSNLGFPQHRAWGECGSLLWRDHLSNYIDRLDAFTVNSTRSIQCPSYGAVWNQINPLEAALRVLEIHPAGVSLTSEAGCYVGEWYLLAHPGSKLTRTTLAVLLDLDQVERDELAAAFHVAHWSLPGFCELDRQTLDLVWSLLAPDGILLLVERTGGPSPGGGSSSLSSSACATNHVLSDFMAAHVGDARVTRASGENGRGQSVQIVRLPATPLSAAAAAAAAASSSSAYDSETEGASPKPFPQPLTLHVVAVSESPTWDSRWEKYLDFLVAHLPTHLPRRELPQQSSSSSSSSSSSLGQPSRRLDLALTVERDTRTFATVIELALRGRRGPQGGGGGGGGAGAQQGPAGGMRRGPGGGEANEDGGWAKGAKAAATCEESAMPPGSSQPALEAAAAAAPATGVLVLISGVRSSQYSQLRTLAARLAEAGAPPVGIIHLQSWRPWDFEGVTALGALYADAAAFAFVRRQHFYAPLAPNAPATPLMPAYYAEHLWPEQGGQGGGQGGGEEEEGGGAAAADDPPVAGLLKASSRPTVCLFAASVSTPGQRRHRAPVLDAIEAHGLPCAVGAISPYPSRVASIPRQYGGEEGAWRRKRDPREVPLLPEAVRAPPPSGNPTNTTTNTPTTNTPTTNTPYVAALRTARLVLCPAGDDLETFRFWEALEAGAVPVTVLPAAAAAAAPAASSSSPPPPPLTPQPESELGGGGAERGEDEIRRRLEQHDHDINFVQRRDAFGRAGKAGTSGSPEVAGDPEVTARLSSGAGAVPNGGPASLPTPFLEAFDSPLAATAAAAAGSWGDPARCPFPVLPSWAHLPQLMHELSGGGGNRIDDLQAKLGRCYRDLKDQVRVDLSAAVTGLFFLGPGR